MVFGVRETGEQRLFPGIADLTLMGLTRDDATALLTSATAGQLDDQVRERLVAETGGNPLALLELAGGMSVAELAGGFATPGSTMAAGVLNSIICSESGRSRSDPAPAAARRRRRDW